MKPPKFDYYAVDTIEAAASYLSEYSWDGKILAGGQSLIPTMNFRLAQPGVLIDINPVQELDFIRVEGDKLHIGAMARHRAVERSPLVAEHAPLIHETMPWIAHAQIRNRGTFGGSLAHADPAAELPAVTLALGAEFRAVSANGERWLPASEFFVDLFETALAPEELLTEVAIPALPARTGYAITEMARRHGDYALVGVTALITLDAAGTCEQAKLVFLSVGPGPVEAFQAEALLVGETPSEALIAEAAEVATTQDIEPTGDIHASAAYRRHLARVLSQQALTQAVERARA